MIMALKPKPTDAELKNILAEHAKWMVDPSLGKRADLDDTDLALVNLTCANLARARLSYADLIGANLTHAKLTHAKLTDAWLTHANLYNANLIGADLTHANLIGANLHGADLTGSVGGDFTQTVGTYWISGNPYERGVLISPSPNGVNVPGPAPSPSPSAPVTPTAKIINICQCPIRDLMTSGHNSNCVERR